MRIKILTAVAILAILATPVAPSVGQAAMTSEVIRLKNGKLLREGNTKTELLKAWGFPDMQQGGVFYYKRDRYLYRFEFDGRDRIRFIQKQE